MKYETILLETGNNIATITLNRPEKRNTLTPRLSDEMIDVLDVVDRDESVRVVVLTAAGSVFCAGADMKEWFFPLAEQRKKGIVGDWTSHFAERTPMAMARLRKPIIAAINGPAVGWGCSITLPCDIRIASELAKFSLPFVRVGISPEMGSSYFLPRLVGMAKACEIIFTGRMLDAAEAKEIGLVNQVVPPENLMKVAYELAGSIARHAPLALMVSKRLLYRGLDADYTTHIQYESYSINYLFSTEDFAEASRAFLEKRPPVFKGK